MILLPIGDATPRKTKPWVTVFLILANIAAFIWTFTRADPETVFNAHALFPAQWTIKDLLTSMFLHANLLHIGGNLLFLWTVGPAVEDRLTPLTFLFFYLACGIAGAVGHILFVAAGQDMIPMVGASGAISGVIGAYFLLFPGSKITMVFFFFILKTFTVPSWFAVGAWIATQVLLAREQLDGKTTNVAVFAHIGGLVFGLGAALLIRMIDLGKAVRKSM